MNNKSKKNKNLFFIYRDKMVAVLSLCLFIWLIFGSFVLLENINSSLVKVEPKFIYLINNNTKLNKFTTSTTDIQMTSSSYPVAVMFDNNSLARPQSGLSQADFIYEALVEGGATRLMAIMNLNKSEVEIGPVRSARPYFVNWAAEFKALYVHAGGSPDALSLIRSSSIQDLNEISGYGYKYFYRKSQRNAPHNLYTSTDNLKQALIDFKLDQIDQGVYDNFIYSKSVATTTASAQELFVNFSEGSVYDARFVYSSDDNIYYRYDNDLIKTDFSTKAPIQIKNIIIQLIPPEVILDSAGRLSLAIIGSGNGYLLRAGYRQEITWQKETAFSSTKFFSQSKEVELLPGLTWILVVPTDREIIFK